MKEEKPVIRFPIWKDFTFKEVFSDKAVTVRFLESLLGIRLKKLIYLHAEDEVRTYAEGRWEYLDILAQDENEVVYNIEMQGGHLEVIPYRYRTNGSGLDMKLIPRGIKTNALKDIPRRYIIFVCRNDPFGESLRQYTICQYVQETGKKMDDKTELICLNASGTKGGVPVDIRAFLDYVKTGNDDGKNAFVHSIHQKVTELNQNEEFVRYGMTLEQKINDSYDDGMLAGEEKGRMLGRTEGKAEGRIEGKAEGKAEGLQEGRIQGAVDLMKEDGYTDDQIISRIVRKYHLTRMQAEGYLH